MSKKTYHFVFAGHVERPVHRRGRLYAYAWRAAYAWNGFVPWMTRAEARLFATQNGGRATFAR